MIDSECCRDKLSQYKVGGPSKPFVDQNLQLQLPEWNPPEQTLLSHSRIYSHYIGSSPSSFSLPVNETEIYQAIAQAEHSYAAWKQMQQKLKEALKLYPH